AARPPATPTRPAAEVKRQGPDITYDEKAKVLSSAEGKFTVYMPAQPKPKNLNVLGVTMKSFFYQQQDGAYGFAFADPPIPAGESSEQTQKRLDGARDGMVRNIQGELVGESRIWLQAKHPGREVRADLPGKVGIARARVYLVGQRMYQVIAVGRPAWVNSVEATKFLDSLALAP